MTKTSLTLATLLTASAAHHASAAIVLEIDVTNPNAFIFRTAGGASAITASESFGIVLMGFLNDPPFARAAPFLGNIASMSARYEAAGEFAYQPETMGLMLWSTGVVHNFTAGTQAFYGQAVWNPSAFLHDFAPIGRIGDIVTTSAPGRVSTNVIGQYRIVPAPASLALAGFGLAAIGTRRRPR